MIYLAMLLVVALIGGISAVGLKVAQIIQIRNAEAELLAIGREFRNALQSYAEATPNGFPSAPDSLSELIRDPRYPGTRRHLRRVYYDPFTGKQDWGIIRGPDKRIAGIHSLSDSETLKRENFPSGLEGFTATKRHSDWVFSITISPKADGS
jgi:type II secretory pathway pseudopilin PulG